MKYFFYFLIAGFLFEGDGLYGQNNVTTDFPKYVDTGNPQKDAQTYAAEKKAWILTHEEKYHKIPEATKQVLFFNNPSSKKEVISENTSTPKCANCEQPVQMSAKEIADKQAQSNTALHIREAKDENWKSAEEWAAIKLREIELQDILEGGGEELKQKLLWIADNEESYMNSTEKKEATLTIAKAKRLKSLLMMK